MKIKKVLKTAVLYRIVKCEPLKGRGDYVWFYRNGGPLQAEVPMKNFCIYLGADVLKGEDVQIKYGEEIK